MKLIRTAAATMLIAGLAAGCGGHDPDGAAPKKGDAGPSPDNQTKTDDGPVTWGNWQVLGELTPEADKTGQFQLSTRVKNVGSNPDEAFSRVRILEGGNTVGKLDCHTKTVQPNETATLECFSADNFVDGWDNIVVEVGS